MGWRPARQLCMLRRPRCGGSFRQRPGRQARTRAPVPAFRRYGAVRSRGQAGWQGQQRQPRSWGWATGRRAVQPCVVHRATCRARASLVRQAARQLSRAAAAWACLDSFGVGCAGTTCSALNSAVPGRKSTSAACAALHKRPRLQCMLPLGGRQAFQFCIRLLSKQSRSQRHVLRSCSVRDRLCRTATA